MLSCVFRIPNGLHGNYRHFQASLSLTIIHPILSHPLLCLLYPYVSLTTLNFKNDLKPDEVITLTLIVAEELVE
ncbi:unnamed protein product [Brugia pahangi]|uniref:Ovule protein n=1 Tax=Brugia pahangi TaxID=6280 RepID=A0A0N4T462_BRUPA|nr:unnamed protein product [Brugia pahangi]